MKRYSLFTVSVLLVLLSASASFAIFPASPDGKITLPLQQGFFLGKPVWYICTDTNDITTSRSQFVREDQTLNLTPKLSSLLPRMGDFKGAPEMYVITNAPCTQGPVFTTTPYLPKYSGKWRVVYVTFKKPCFARNVTNALPAVPKINPYGLPSKLEACYDKTNIVVDYPIMAIGELGAPGQIDFGLANRLSYRIGEAKLINYRAKTITLPTYYAYCADPLTKEVMTVEFIVTETTDCDDARWFGWSYAPGLMEVCEDDTMKLWAFGFSRVPDKPIQYPVLQACPTPLGRRNHNYDYSPIMDGFEIFDGYPCTTLNNPTVIERLLCRNVISDEFVERMNGSVVGIISTGTDGDDEDGDMCN